MERAASFDVAEVLPEHLPEPVRQGGPARAPAEPPEKNGSSAKPLRDQVNRTIAVEIAEALRASDGNQSEAARALGVARNTLRKYLSIIRERWPELLVGIEEAPPLPKGTP